MATTPPEDNQDNNQGGPRYDLPGRNGLGMFAGMNFARSKNIPSDDTDAKTLSNPGRGPQAFARMIAPAGITPDQGCFASIMGAALLILSIGFWFFIYYTHADEFRGPNEPKGPSRVQVEQERQAAHRNRINP